MVPQHRVLESGPRFVQAEIRLSDRFILVSENFPPKTGGSGKWFWDLYSRLGADVTVLTDDLLDSDAFDRASGLDIVRWPMRSQEWGMLSRVGARHHASCSRKLIELIRSGTTPASVHCGRTLPEGLTGLAARMFTALPMSVMCTARTLRCAGQAAN